MTLLFCQDWLNFKHVSDSQALAALRPATELRWHRVGKLVNNSRNKSEECNKPFEQAAKPEKPKGMLAWLTGTKQSKRKSSELKTGGNCNADSTSSDIEIDAKRPRRESNETDDQEIESKIKVEPS